jgi:hypothetical protein
MTQATTRSRSAIAAHPIISAAIAVLVAADILLVLIVPIYAHSAPAWGDFPFFYWYLLIIMPVISLLLWIASQLQKRLTSPESAAGSEDGR